MNRSRWGPEGYSIIASEATFLIYGGAKKAGVPFPAPHAQISVVSPCPVRRPEISHQKGEKKQTRIIVGLLQNSTVVLASCLTILLPTNARTHFICDRAINIHQYREFLARAALSYYK